MSKNRYLSWMAATVFAVGLTALLPIFAQAQTGMQYGGGRFGMRGGMAPGVFGTVTSVDGTALSVTSRARRNATSTPGTVYAVDASNAQVIKGGASSTVSEIAVGDMVMVQGTVSGTSITATVIRDGIGPVSGRSGIQGGFGRGFGRNSTSTPPNAPIQGNGQPVVGGSVASISGTTIVVTNASNVTYTVDASNAKIVKGGVSSSTLSDIATGDNVVVQGAVNGTSVTASSIIDQGTGGSRAPPASGQQGGSRFGFLGVIGNFFKHLFGF